MVERIYRAQGELNVALRVNVVQDLERDLADVLHVHVFIHHDDALGEHGLAQRPDGVHHLARLAGIRFANRDQHQVVKDAFNRKIDVHQLRNCQPHQREKDALDCLAHPSVFHGRLAHDGRRIDRVLAVSDARNVKDRVKIFERVIPSVVAEGALGAKFVEVNVPFEDDLGGGGNFEINGFALDQLNRLLAEKAGDEIFLHVGRRGNDRGKSKGGVGADGHRNFHLSPRALSFDQQ